MINGRWVGKFVRGGVGRTYCSGICPDGKKSLSYSDGAPGL